MVTIYDVISEKKGKSFKRRNMSSLHNFVNKNYQIQKICKEPGRYKF